LAEHAAAIRALGKCIILGRAVSNLLKRGLISPAEAELRFSELYPDNGGAP
jgi:hypothetical protein